MKTRTLDSTVIYRSAFRVHILNLFSRISQGSLHLTLPGNIELSYGDPTATPVKLDVHDERFFDACFLSGDIGFGESYVNGYWSSNDITSVIRLFIKNLEKIPGISGSKTRSFFFNLFRSYNKLIHSLRANSISGSRKNISMHYDLSNEFFRTFLDESMTYSSAFFHNRQLSLEEAQLAKYERLWEKLNLTEEDHVLEIGCGWGYNAVEMAKRFGCKVTAITISSEQYKEAAERVTKENLNDKVEIRLIDYRNLKGRFSKIISIEMLEAVGHDYMDAYFSKLSSLLQEDGIAAFQVITCPDSRYDQLRRGTDWIQKHIFPGTLLPSVGVINKSITSNTSLTLVDLKDIGLDYAKTLNLWRHRFNDNLEKVKQLGFDETFIRKWNYYLCYCEAAFETRNINVMQMIYSPPNNPHYT